MNTYTTLKPMSDAKSLHHVNLCFFAVIALGITSFSYQGYQFYQQVSRQPSVIDSTSVSLTERQLIKPPIKTISSSQMVALNLFGEYRVQEVGPILVNLPETTLSLKLLAAFTDSDASKSSAVISGAGTRSGKKSGSETYAINDVLPNGVTLIAVNTNSIVIKRENEMETLHFPGYQRGAEKVAEYDHRSKKRKRRVSPGIEEENITAIPESTRRELMSVVASNESNQGVRQSIQNRLEQLRRR